MATATAARKARRFVKAVFDTPAAMADEAAGFLIARGAIGCAVGKMLRPGAMEPNVVSVEAFFDRVSPSQLAGLSRAMASAGMLTDSARRPRAERIVDPGWSTLWMKRFEPMPVGRRLLIVPPWSKARDPRRLAIVIKPARAFGTGHHPTTAGVLRALERLCASRQFKSGLDVGTGSGVLAIAMKILGVGEVLGIDIDADALHNARENAELNRLGGKLKFSATPLDKLDRRFDLIVANILASTLIAMAPRLTRILSRDGRLVLAGILAREADEILRYYRRALRCFAMNKNRGWVTLVLGR